MITTLKGNLLQRDIHDAILATTAALWFRSDAKRVERWLRRACLYRKTARIHANAETSAQALTATDLLAWRADIDEGAKSELRRTMPDGNAMPRNG